jgi:type I restriction enzyme M protein
VFTRQTEIERYSRMVPLAEIADSKNVYNLNIPRYIDSSEPEDIQDLNAHLHGGVPDRDLDLLSGYWSAFPLLRGHLFKPNRPGYSNLTLDVSQVHKAILDSPEFQKFATAARDLTTEWFTVHRDRLAGIEADTKPADLITAISEDLLARFKPVALLDEYDVYEQLMTYWDDVMHDDVFLIMNDGWLDAAKPRTAIENKDRKLTETPDLVVGSGRGATKFKMDLIPPALVVARYFAEEQSKIDELTAVAEEASRGVEGYLEEHAVEDGLLADSMVDDKISKALASARLKEAKDKGSDQDEVEALMHLLKLYDAEAAAKKAAKETQAALDLATLKKYGNLTEQDVKTLVLHDKWSRTITTRVASVVDMLTAALVSRIQELGARYSDTVGSLEAELEKLDTTVAGHLAAMGIEL